MSAFNALAYDVKGKTCEFRGRRCIAPERGKTTAGHRNDDRPLRQNMVIPHTIIRVQRPHGSYASNMSEEAGVVALIHLPSLSCEVAPPADLSPASGS